MDNFFPNFKMFVEVARPLTHSTKQDVFDDKEVYRLKKLTLEVRRQMANEYVFVFFP